MSERLSDLLSTADTDAAPLGPSSVSTELNPAVAEDDTSRPEKRSQREIYARPLPIRTFPLPTFYPSNPLSLVHIAYVWLRQTVFPPRDTVVEHTGVWSPETKSVHVHDEQSMRALWEQGFFGKGHLSRSEPNWQKVLEVKRGLKKDFVSEMHTLERRDERKQKKWVRARLEQEAIRQTRERESYERALNAFESLKPPVGPLQLLALPNTAPMAPQIHVTGGASNANGGASNGHALAGSVVDNAELEAGAGSMSLVDGLELNGDASMHPTTEAEIGAPLYNGTGTRDKAESGIETDLLAKVPFFNGIDTPNKAINGLEADLPAKAAATDDSNGPEDFKPTLIKRRKSVRFSPKVESTTFQLSDPPSPGAATLCGKGSNGSIPAESLNGGIAHNDALNGEIGHEAGEVNDKEHLQLTREEAFFLAYGLGVLKVVDSESKQAIPTAELFSLFRRYSVVPPPVGPADLRPDDKFLIQYAVYHHFRSVGWVPRSGIKFAVDWLLYQKGPVFDHAEYGVIVMPSYTDPWWKAQGQEAPKMAWHSFHMKMRGLSHVFKTIVPVYVDIPPPPVFDDALEKGGITGALKLFKIREFIVTRFKFSRLKTSGSEQRRSQRVGQ